MLTPNGVQLSQAAEWLVSSSAWANARAAHRVTDTEIILVYYLACISLYCEAKCLLIDAGWTSRSADRMLAKVRTL
jgi:hypothetical protein